MTSGIFSASFTSSVIVSADHPGLTFSLRLIRSEPTYNQPVQQWSFVSDFAVSVSKTFSLLPSDDTAHFKQKMPALLFKGSWLLRHIHGKIGALHHPTQPGVPAACHLQPARTCHLWPWHPIPTGTCHRTIRTESTLFKVMILFNQYMCFHMWVTWFSNTERKGSWTGRNQARKGTLFCLFLFLT